MPISTAFFRRPASIPRAPAGLSPSEAHTDTLPPYAGATNGGISPEFLDSLRSEFGRAASFSSGGRLHVAFFEPADIDLILTTSSGTFVKGEQESALSAGIGWGLISQEGGDHLTTRRGLHWGVHGEMLESYAQSLVGLARARVGALYALGEFALGPEMRQLAHEASLTTIFSTSSAPVNPDYEHSIFEMNEFLMGRYATGPTSRRLKDDLSHFTTHRKRASQYISEIIAAVDKSPDRAPTSLIDLIVDWNADDDVDHEPGGRAHAQVALFLQAATETTAALLCWMTLLLGQHPDVYRALQQEVLDAAPADGEMTVKDYMSLPIMNAVISEALRIYPPAWLLPRIANEDVEIGGYTIAAGTRVVISPYATHRDAQHYPDPMEFRIERWSASAVRPPKGAFIPFGRGNRACIGERLALLTASVIMCEMAKGPLPVAHDTEITIVHSSLILSPSRSLMVEYPRP